MTRAGFVVHKESLVKPMVVRSGPLKTMMVQESWVYGKKSPPQRLFSMFNPKNQKRKNYTTYHFLTSDLPKPPPDWNRLPPPVHVTTGLPRPEDAEVLASRCRRCPRDRCSPPSAGLARSIRGADGAGAGRSKGERPAVFGILEGIRLLNVDFFWKGNGH